MGLSDVEAFNQPGADNNPGVSHLSCSLPTAVSRPHRGKVAEDAAHRFLLEQGYLPMARNVRCRFGEIDLIARENGALVFVEIKARSADPSGERAALAVDGNKRARLAGLASWYLAHAGLSPETFCRFDVVLVSLSRAGQPLSASVVQDAF